MEQARRKTGSLLGLAIVLAMGFAFYFLLNATAKTGGFFTYDGMVEQITGSVGKQIAWFFMNFTEPQFYAGLFAGIAVILGGVVAWLLARKNSRFAGFDICYGNSSLFPWILASQALSLALTIFVFRYINLFHLPGAAWAATFITVVGAPPSIVLLYGPSVSALLTSSVLASLLSAPLATWLATYVGEPLALPGVVANVLTMAITGVVICTVCSVAPWVKKREIRPHRKTPARQEDVHSTGWFVRRCLADFSEAQFYGNEVVSIVLLAGMLADWLTSPALTVHGTGTLPGILLSQFVASGVGVFLYAEKFDKGGWYATYVPVVSVGPACVMMFGSTIPVALFAGALGGVLGAPVADLLAKRLPAEIHGTNANVTAMALCTIMVMAVMRFIGVF